MIRRFLLILLLLVPGWAWATISTETLRSDYDCDGSQDTYTYAFQIYEDDDLEVIVKAASGTEQVLVLNVDYTVTGAGGSSGTIVLTDAEDCDDGETLSLIRQIELQQSTDYVDGELFSAESMETALDKLTLLDQQQQDEINRSVRFPPGTDLDGELPDTSASDRADKLIGFDSSGEITIRADIGTVDEDTLVLETDLQDRGMWWVASDVTDHGDTEETGSLAALLADASAGDTIRFPNGSYSITTPVTSSLDNVTIKCDEGVVIAAAVSGMTPLTLSGDGIVVDGCKFQGEGTFVTGTNGFSVFGLLDISGDHATVKHSHFLNPETYGIQIGGAYALIDGNIFEGGDYFADAAAISTDRQHYGIQGTGAADYATITNNRFIPNSDANAGAQIQNITMGTTTDPAYGVIISDNVSINPWEHFIYAELYGSTVANNTAIGSGIKIEQDTAGTYTQGNVIEGNHIIGDRAGDPLETPNGIQCNRSQNTIIRGNVIQAPGTYGIILSAASADTKTLSGNVIEGNTITGVIDGSGSDSVGIYAGDDVDTFSNNIITGNIIRSIGDDIDGTTAGIYLELNDTANHLYNEISYNTIDITQEIGMSLNHLTYSNVIGNKVTGNGAGGANPAFLLTDLQNCTIKQNTMIGTASQMTYGFYEASCGNNIYDDNTIVNADTANYRVSGWSTTDYIGKTWNGTPGPLTFSTADNRTITAAELLQTVHLRDPNGGNRTDTLPAAALLDDVLGPTAGTKFSITYVNTTDAAETILLAAGAGMTLLANEGASDLVLSAGESAVIDCVIVSAAATRCLASKFE